MPAHLYRRCGSLSAIYPPFLVAHLETVAACEARGARYEQTFGYRSHAEQAKLYFQGRTTPGVIVTNAPAGMSAHNYGIAFDSVRDGDLVKVGLQPEWAEAGYDILREEGEKRGLQVGLINAKGKRWDVGHAQLPLTKFVKRNAAGEFVRGQGTQIREAEILRHLKHVHAQGGMPAVFVQLDAWGPWGLDSQR